MSDVDDMRQRDATLSYKEEMLERKATFAEPPRKRSRWDVGPADKATPTTDFAATPATFMTPLQRKTAGILSEMTARNRVFTNADLDRLLPKGYAVVPVPAGYVPIRAAGAKLVASPTPVSAAGFALGGEAAALAAQEMDFGHLEAPGDLPDLKPEDRPFFAKILTEETGLSADEERERTIMQLLLKIKNGTPQQRKVSMRAITDNARAFGPDALFNQLLPLLKSATLDPQERHLLVKVVGRVLFKLDDQVFDHVKRIMVVMTPMLIEKDFFARAEGREIIANLAKAAGLPRMITVMRPDLDADDETVRTITARAFSVVASALGVPVLLPFVRAVCASKKSWQARHTGAKIVYEIARAVGPAVLPHLRSLVACVEAGLTDEQPFVRTMAGRAIAALAQAAAPYGVESFDSVLKPLWYGVKNSRGKGLSAFLRAIGYIIALMDPEYASYYTNEVMDILIREFSTPDEEMKVVVLGVVRQCVATEGVQAQYVRDEILKPFFSSFWVRRTALDRRGAKALVDTTHELALKCGAGLIVRMLLDGVRDDAEPFRIMTVDAIERVIATMGVTDLDQNMDKQLIDGLLFAYAEQKTDVQGVMLKGFGTTIRALGERAKPHFGVICGNAKWRLKNASSQVRKEAADLVSAIAGTMGDCGEEGMLTHLGLILYEFLGEEYPEVLASILKALSAIVAVVSAEDMSPPVQDLLPRLTPILRNRHELVQENCIELVGRIAQRGYRHVAAREWMRISFLLLDVLKATRKSIRKAAVATFGHIALAIGPQEVLVTLLNNLKVQERTMRVCTTVAIGVVAEACGPFTVLSALLNEYRVPELNVQNGILKSIAFLAQYIGPLCNDYAYALIELLDDALQDRDPVHRQTAARALKHLSLACAGGGKEDVLTHLFNILFPNIFEQSPHVINEVMDCVESFRVSLGSGFVLSYVLQGLFHPAQRVRRVYWRIYNNLYLGDQAALVSHHPLMDSDIASPLNRQELFISL